MKIITITGRNGHNNGVIADKLSGNENVGYVAPVTRYSNHKNPNNRVSEKWLYKHLNDGDLLVDTVVNGEFYYFFKSQFKYDFNVIIADDFAVQSLKDKYESDVATIYVEGEGESERFMVDLTSDWFDYTVNEDTDLDYLIEQIASDLMEI